MKKILILCPYPEGVAAGQRLKYEPYMESWKEKGFSIERVKPLNFSKTYTNTF